MENLECPPNVLVEIQQEHLKIGVAILPEELNDELARVHLNNDQSPLSVNTKDAASSGTAPPAHCLDLVWNIEVQFDDAPAKMCAALDLLELDSAEAPKILKFNPEMA